MMVLVFNSYRLAPRTKTCLNLPNAQHNGPISENTQRVGTKAPKIMDPLLPIISLTVGYWCIVFSTSEGPGAYVIDLENTPVYTTPIPKSGSDKPQLSLIWALFWGGCSIEEG